MTRLRWAMLASLSLAPVAPALAASADFLSASTYATTDGCEKLKALAAGGDRNIATVPETLTSKGYSGWEHDCSFKSVSETEAGKSWKTVLSCAEGENEWEEVQVMTRTGEATFEVKAEGESEATVYTVCDAPAPKQGQ